MTQSSSSDPGSTDDLQFATTEPVGTTASAPKCALCQQPITSTYYALNDKVLCPHCSAAVAAPPPGSKAGRVFIAAALGIGAGLLGAVIWFAVRRIANLQMGLIAILVGYMVGKAVNRGSAGRGGLGYQIMAVVITYCCIAANYVPDILEAVVKAGREQNAKAAVAGANAKAPGDQVKPDLADNGDAKGADPQEDKPNVAEAAPPALTGFALLRELVVLFALVFVYALKLPFLAGANNFMGILIIGFALWEAWKFNARRELPISGPYQLGTPSVA
jgi:hypothetical protein